MVNSYYDVLEAMELKRAAEDSRERSQRQLQRTENQYEMGAVTTLELLQVQVQESNDRLLVSRREQSLLAALDGLYTASGVDLHGNPPGIDPGAVVEPLPLSAVSGISLDISSSPSLRAALLGSRASEIRSEAAERSYWPSLRASAGWSWNDGTLDDVDRMFDSDAYSIGMSLSWNIFDGFLRESRIKSARAAALGSEASLESLRNNLEAGVRTLRDLLLIDLQYYHDSLLALELAQERYRLSAMSYEMGSLSLIDLLEAQSDLSASEANLVPPGHPPCGAKPLCWWSWVECQGRRIVEAFRRRFAALLPGVILGANMWSAHGHNYSYPASGGGGPYSCGVGCKIRQFPSFGLAQDLWPRGTEPDLRDLPGGL